MTFDDKGWRILAVETKQWDEEIAQGQIRLLATYARQPDITVWVARGTCLNVSVHRVSGMVKKNAAYQLVGRVLLESGTGADFQRLLDEWFRQAPQFGHRSVVLAETLDGPLDFPNPSGMTSERR